MEGSDEQATNVGTGEYIPLLPALIIQPGVLLRVELTCGVLATFSRCSSITFQHAPFFFNGTRYHDGHATIHSVT